VIATSRLDYALPAELIAQVPAARRDGSRLLVVDRASRRIEHRMFAELPLLLRPGDTLFRNNASVLPARLNGRRSTGGRVECLLLRPAGAATAAGELWQCLVRPGRRLAAGAAFEMAGGELLGTVEEVSQDGSALVRLSARSGEAVVAVAGRRGDVPLPPYIARPDASHRDEDRERYQTVYADGARQVAVAAPTAGLHFTPELLGRISAMGVRTADLTLHVGLGRSGRSQPPASRRIPSTARSTRCRTRPSAPSSPRSPADASPWERRPCARSRIFCRATRLHWEARGSPRHLSSSIPPGRSKVWMR